MHQILRDHTEKINRGKHQVGTDVPRRPTWSPPLTALLSTAIRSCIHTPDFRQIRGNISINISGISVTQVCPNLRGQSPEYLHYLEHGVPVLFKVSAR